VLSTILFPQSLHYTTRIESFDVFFAQMLATQLRVSPGAEIDYVGVFPFFSFLSVLSDTILVLECLLGSRVDVSC
jgi:hypothetical protein